MKMLMMMAAAFLAAGCATGHPDRWRNGPVENYRGVEHSWKAREGVNKYSGNLIAVETFYYLRNTTREPLCAALVFSDDRVKKYQVPRQTLLHLSPGQKATALTAWGKEDASGFTWPIATGVLVMQPSAKGQCNPDISVFTYEQLLEQRK